MKVHLRTLGCRLNDAEIAQWSHTFQSRGHEVCNTPEQADVMVLNTCAVTHDASRKSRNLINRLHKHNPGAQLVVTGCHASLEPKAVADTLGVDLVVKNSDKAKLPELVERELIPQSMPLQATTPGDASLFTRHRQRAFIKIQDGCRYRCTFCIVTIARGDEHSRPVKEIIDEINRLHGSGVEECVLTGVHVGGYGSDLNLDLYSLVRQILSDTDIPRIRFASVEPWDLGDDFFCLFQNPRVMPHMHLPLQSGSDRILRKMSRRCRIGDFDHLLTQAKETVPHFNVTTDIIVGFPGETEDDWQQTMNFVEQCEFGHLHIFPYSPRHGTKAAALPDKVPDEIRRARCQQLAALGQQMKRAVAEDNLQRECAVLWEKQECAKANRFSGYSENYLRVVAEAPKGVDLKSTISRCRLNRFDVQNSQLHAILL